MRIRMDKDWIAIGTSVLALMVSLASYYTSVRATDVTEQAFQAERQLTLIGQISNLMEVRLKAQSSSHVVSRIRAYGPSSLNFSSREASIPDFVVSLGPTDFYVAQAVLAKEGRPEPNSSVIHNCRIPIVLRANYSVAGASYVHTGLYFAVCEVRIEGDPNQSLIGTFRGLYFDKQLDPSVGDLQQFVDHVWTDEGYAVQSEPNQSLQGTPRLPAARPELKR